MFCMEQREVDVKVVIYDAPGWQSRKPITELQKKVVKIQDYNTYWNNASSTLWVEGIINALINL